MTVGAPLPATVSGTMDFGRPVDSRAHKGIANEEKPGGLALISSIAKLRRRTTTTKAWPFLR